MTAAVTLAMRPDQERVASVADIVQGSGISRSYLEQLCAKLRRAGVLEGQRGVAGGYRLAARPEQISIAQIVRAVDSMDATACGGSSDCRDGSQCITHDLWVGLNRCVEDFLSRVTLAQVAAEAKRRNAGPEQIAVRLQAQQEQS